MNTFLLSFFSKICILVCLTYHLCTVIVRRHLFSQKRKQIRGYHGNTKGINFKDGRYQL